MLRIFSLLFSFLLIQTAYAQNWYKLADLSPTVVLRAVEVAPNGDVYVMADNGYPYYSQDNGETWSPFEAPPFATYTANGISMHCDQTTGRVYIGTSIYGMSHTANRGSNWSHTSFNPNSVSGLDESIQNIASNGNLVVVTGDVDFFGNGQQRYFYSIDGGFTFGNAVLGNGIGYDILIDNGTDWIVATGVGLQRTTNSGFEWSFLGFENQEVHAVAKSNSGTYFAAVQDEDEEGYTIYSSTNLADWSSSFTLSVPFVYEMDFSDEEHTLYLATENGLYKFLEAFGLPQPIGEGEVRDLALLSNDLLGYTANNQVGLQVGTDDGMNWETKSEGLERNVSYFNDFKIYENSVYTLDGYSRFLSYFSLNEPSNLTFGLIEDPTIPGGSSPDELIVDEDGAIYIMSAFKLHRSTNNGQTWISIGESFSIPVNSNGIHRYKLLRKTGAHLYTAQESDNMRLYESDDMGSNWNQILDQSTLQGLGFLPSIQYQDVLETTDGNLYAMVVTLALDTKLIQRNSNGEWIDITPSFFEGFPASQNVQLTETPTGDIWAFTNNAIYDITGTPGEITVPWNANSNNYQNLFFEFDNAGNLYVNLTGNEFCTECGLYKRTGTSWENLGSPFVLSDYTPIAGLQLIADSIPVVITTFNNEAPQDTKGYYYYNETELTTAVSSLEETLDVSIFPNPASTEFLLSIDESVELEMMDVQGRVVLEQNVGAGDAVDVSFIASGMYFVKIQTDKGIATKKIVVKR